MAAAIVVPLVVAWWRADAFVLPRLAVLWVLLVSSSVAMAVGAFRASGRSVVLRMVPALDIPLGVFIAVFVLATVFSVDPGQSLIGERGQYQGLLTTLLYVLFFVVARLVVTDLRRLVVLFVALSWSGTVVALYAISQRLGIDPIWGDDVASDRAFASIGQSNALASYLVVTVPVAVMIGRWVRPPLRTLVAVAVGLQVVAVGLTQSRAGYVALLLLAALIVFVPSLRPAPTSELIQVALMAAMIAAVLLATFSPLRSVVSEPWDRLATIQNLTEDVSIRDHRDLWTVARHVTAENPMLGTGPETFPDIFPSYSREVLSVDRATYFDAFRVESPHNLPLAIASGAGVAAIGAFAAFVVAVGLEVRSAARRDAQIAAALLTVLAAGAAFGVTSLFITADLTSTWLVWVLGGAAVGVAGSAPVDRPGAR